MRKLICSLRKLSEKEKEWGKALQRNSVPSPVIFQGWDIYLLRSRVLPVLLKTSPTFYRAFPIISQSKGYASISKDPSKYSSVKEMEICFSVTKSPEIDLACYRGPVWVQEEVKCYFQLFSFVSFHDKAFLPLRKVLDKHAKKHIDDLSISVRKLKFSQASSENP